MSQTTEVDSGTAFLMRRIDRQRSARVERLLLSIYGDRDLKESARSLVEDLRSMCRVRDLSWDEVIRHTPVGNELVRVLGD